jgi:glutathione S-transferase
MIELYHDANAVCCQKVELALSEKGLAWTGRTVSLARGEQLGPDYLKINPAGYLPALVHDGVAICESTVICEYLDDIEPQPALRPTQPQERAAMRLWTKRVDEVLHEAGSVLSFLALWGDRFKKLEMPERDRRYKNVGDPIRDDMYRSTVEAGLASPYAARAVISFERAFADMEAALEDGSKWIVADQFTLADIGLAPYVARLEYLNILELWLTDRRHVKEWWQRVTARPSFAAAIAGPLSTQERTAMNTTGTKLRPHIETLRRGILPV